MRRRPGKTRERLADMLAAALGLDWIDPQLLRRARGYWAQRFQDVYRWEIDIRIPGTQLSLWISSWDTMSKVVQSGGIDLTPDSRNGLSWMASAAPKTNDGGATALVASLRKDPA